MSLPLVLYYSIIAFVLKYYIEVFKATDSSFLPHIKPSWYIKNNNIFRWQCRDQCLKDSKFDAEMIAPSYLQLIPFPVPPQKADRSWKMTLNYGKQEEAPVLAAVPDVAKAWTVLDVVVSWPILIWELKSIFSQLLGMMPANVLHSLPFPVNLP